MSEASTDRLMADLKRVVADAESLLSRGADVADEGAHDLRAKLQARLTEAQHKLSDLQDISLARARAAGKAADQYVHDNPWSSIGAAAAVGLLVGVLLGRR
jgi:ElaB/YqjD/DUF883 family membrane-anchored ribosome-binding protein